MQKTHGKIRDPLGDPSLLAASQQAIAPCEQGTHAGYPHDGALSMQVKREGISCYAYKHANNDAHALVTLGVQRGRPRLKIYRVSRGMNDPIVDMVARAVTPMKHLITHMVRRGIPEKTPITYMVA